MSVLALDAGTTGVTAAVVGPRGGILATARHEVARHAPHPGWVEHAPEEIWQATLGAAREVLGVVDASGLSAIGVTNQRDTVVLWDRETLGSPRRAIGGLDRRTADLCERMSAAGHGDRVAELAGLPLDPRFSAPTLTWLAEHEPHTWALVEAGRYAVGTVDSYLVARMTRGTWHVTDASNASRTLLLDLGSGDWSDELCRLFGVPRDALPDLVPSWGVVAPSDPRSFLGLGLPIAGIAGDQQAALVGQACFDVGDSRLGLAPENSVVVNTGTTLVRSAAGLLPTVAWRSPDGVLAHALEGTAIGPDEVASVVRDLQRAVPEVASLRVDGAAAVDDLLCQAHADRVGLPLERPASLATAALGAAFLAGLGTGVWGSTDELREAWVLDRRFLPARASA